MRKGMRLLPPKVAAERVGYSVSRIYQLSRDPDNSFPSRYQLSPQRSGWLEHEIDAWIAARVKESQANSAA